MGTPDFAVAPLDALAEAGHTIVCCVTQPDRAKGRKKELVMPPVKQYAMAHDIPVLQPVSVRDKSCIGALRAFQADVFVVAAFGQILPAEVLDIAPCGCINIHASLLPRFRGAAPIQQAILQGEAQSGVTIMQMDAGCDTGDILLQEAVAIEADETGGSLFEKLAALGARLIVEALDALADGTLTATPQDGEKATVAPKLTRESGRIDWDKDTAWIARSVRAFDPWPGAYTTLHGKILKITGASDATARAQFETAAASPGGCVLSATKQGIFVKTGDGILQVNSLQPEGKKPMDAVSFLNGNRLESGTVLGR